MTLKIFQITGFKNSGKTRLMCELIKTLSSRGYKTASLKHHAHGPEKMAFDPGRDTGKHYLSGAAVTGLTGPHQAVIDFEMEVPIEAYIAFYKALDIEVLLIEGFKQASFPKAVILRSEEELEFFQGLKNIKAYIAPKDIRGLSLEAPLFEIEDLTAFTSFFLEWMEGEN
ncbi:MAG: molybdopterin-guanine dinucleotide biosynthesis protein B [Tuberibacillus sp.]